jgi:3-oxocholest-4-en-26-oyl-CoA dehydrogenase beta subunit
MREINMDFSFNEEQTAVAELSRKIFTERVTQAALREAEADPDRLQRVLWGELATAGLLGTAIPEEHGGSGHGLLALCALLTEAGAAAAMLPLWPTLVLGALPIAALGSAEQRARFLPRVASGECFLTAAFTEPGGGDPSAPGVSAVVDGDGYVLRGVKTCVPAAHLAERILVAARGPAGPVLLLLDPKAEGVKLERQITTTEEVEGLLTLDGARVGAADVLGDPAQGAAQLAWVLERAMVGLCAIELGVAERAMRMTASYTMGRKQFERPIATFQAVSQRIADAYIDVEAIRLSMLRAAWKLESSLPAADDVALAKAWAAEGGHRVVFTAQHLHAGMGFDRDYPLHRYYTRSRLIELTLGGATQQYARLGAKLAVG